MPEFLSPSTKSLGARLTTSFELSLILLKVTVADTIEVPSLGSSKFHEKATKLSEFNKVVFEVASKSNKNEIKGAIEKLFSVKVKSVNIINTKGKVKRFKGVLGKRNDMKKAVITLVEGNTIDISAGV